MKNLKILLILLIIISINEKNSNSQSVQQGSLKLKIKVLNSEGNIIDNAIIKVYENDKEIKIVEGSSNILFLDLNKTYIIEVLDNEYKKYISVNSSVPEKLNNKICQVSCKFRMYHESSSYERPSAQVTYLRRKFQFRQVLYCVSSLNDFK
jgi:hypothetical protein